MKFIHYLSLLILLLPLTMARIKSKKYSKAKAKNPIDDFGRPYEPAIGPKGMPFNKTTSCDIFGRYARFNPHSITGIKWFVFYYWSQPMEIQLFQFRIPSGRDLKLLHKHLDGHLPSKFNWSSNLVLRKELVTNFTTLLEEKGDRGQYAEYGLYRNIPKGRITLFRYIRIKQTGDSKYLAIMSCQDHTAIVMSNIKHVPPQHKLQDEAMRLGYIGRRGKSYLYQGHEWMPIPEQQEKEFWFINRRLMKL